MATKVWAHRGASAYAPENTIPAFRMAMEMGADGIELDVQESSDGKLIILHDARVDRTSNGSGRVADMTCQELKKLDFSYGMAEYKDTRIPTLKEVYGLIKKSRMIVNVEVKCDEVIYPGIWDKLIRLEREMGMHGRVIYSSFNHYVLQKIRDIDLDARIGLLYDNAMVDPWVYAGYLNANAIHPHCKAALLCPGLMEGCRENGIDVNAWAADTQQDMTALIEKGANAIITNSPDVALGLLGR